MVILLNLNFSANAIPSAGHPAGFSRGARAFCGQCLQWDIKVI